MSMFINRLKKNHTHLKKWAKREGCEAYRVYDRDIPEYPFAVDLYGTSVVLYEYLKPRKPKVPEVELSAESLEEAEADVQAALDVGIEPEGTPEPDAADNAKLESVVADLLEYFGIGLEDLFVKFRKRQKGLVQYERLANARSRRIVSEGGLKFHVNLSDYLDTGLFLDHRKTRALVRSLSAGKQVLNLFCYAGSVSAYAAQGQAASVTSVDLSNTYINWARQNFELNDLRGAQYYFIREDVMKYLRDAREAEIKFDFIFVDPPSFSNSKKMDGIFDVQLHHVPLLQGCLDLLTENGVILFSNNFRKFKFDLPSFEGVSITDISQKTIPEDFRNRKIHRAWILSK